MFQRITVGRLLGSAILFAVALLALRVASAQISTDWRKRYGPPQAERYIVGPHLWMTVFYSDVGQTCKAAIEPIGSDSEGSPTEHSLTIM